jgi:hypothetical protein
MSNDQIQIIMPFKGAGDGDRYRRRIKWTVTGPTLHIQNGGTTPNDANHMSSWTPNPNPARAMLN